MSIFEKTCTEMLPSWDDTVCRDLNLITSLQCCPDFFLTYVDFEREAGADRWNKTSFLPSQKTWGLDRRHRPEELFIYEQPPNRRSRVYNNVGPMYRYNHLVLDLHDHLVKGYPDIPDTLSSEFEGAYMETITRKDIRIDIEDFRARMPPRITSKGAARDLYVANIFSSRMRRFREATFNLVWTVRRSGSDVIKGFLDSFLPPGCKASNSTRNFRDMHKHESVMKEMLTFGQYAFRAGNNGRAVSNASREASYKKIVAKYDKLYAAFMKDQQKLANGLLPHSTTQLETPAYHQLLSNWRAAIARQHGEDVEEEEEDLTITPGEEGQATAATPDLEEAPATVSFADGEDNHASETGPGKSITRKRTIANFEEGVHGDITHPNKRSRLSPTDLFGDIAEGADVTHTYDNRTDAVPQTAVCHGCTLNGNAQTEVYNPRGQKRSFDRIDDHSFLGEEVNPRWHQDYSRPAKRHCVTEDEVSCPSYNVGQEKSAIGRTQPSNCAGLQKPKPTFEARARSRDHENTHTRIGGQQPDAGQGHRTWSTSPTETTHKLQPYVSYAMDSTQGNVLSSYSLMTENTTQDEGSYDEFNIRSPPYFARNPYSQPSPYQDQNGLLGRQPVRRRPAPQVHAPLQCELIQGNDHEAASSPPTRGRDSRVRDHPSSRPRNLASQKSSQVLKQTSAGPSAGNWHPARYPLENSINTYHLNAQPQPWNGSTAPRAATPIKGNGQMGMLHAENASDSNSWPGYNHSTVSSVSEPQSPEPNLEMFTPCQEYASDRHALIVENGIVEGDRIMLGDHDFSGIKPLRYDNVLGDGPQPGQSPAVDYGHPFTTALSVEEGCNIADLSQLTDDPSPGIPIIYQDDSTPTNHQASVNENPSTGFQPEVGQQPYDLWDLGDDNLFCQGRDQIFPYTIAGQLLQQYHSTEYSIEESEPSRFGQQPSNLRELDEEDPLWQEWVRNFLDTTLDPLHQQSLATENVIEAGKTSKGSQQPSDPWNLGEEDLFSQEWDQTLLDTALDPFLHEHSTVENVTKDSLPSPAVETH